MINYYSIIIIMFTVAGAWLAIASVKKIKRKKILMTWPEVNATVVVAESSSAQHDMLPYIEFEYVVDGQSFRGSVELPVGESSAPGFAEKFVAEYSLGKALVVHYDPTQHDVYQLDPAIKSEDWLMLVLGIGAIGLGCYFLINNW